MYDTNGSQPFLLPPEVHGLVNLRADDAGERAAGGVYPHPVADQPRHIILAVVLVLDAQDRRPADRQRLLRDAASFRQVVEALGEGRGEQVVQALAAFSKGD